MVPGGLFVRGPRTGTGLVEVFHMVYVFTLRNFKVNQKLRVKGDIVEVESHVHSKVYRRYQTF